MTDPWSITIKFRRRPHCPGCGTAINRDACSVFNGWLWCFECHQTGVSRASTVLATISKEWVLRQSSVAVGLYAFTPTIPFIKDKSVLEADLILDEKPDKGFEITEETEEPTRVET